MSPSRAGALLVFLVTVRCHADFLTRSPLTTDVVVGGTTNSLRGTRLPVRAIVVADTTDSLRSAVGIGGSRSQEARAKQNTKNFHHFYSGNDLRSEECCFKTSCASVRTTLLRSSSANSLLG